MGLATYACQRILKFRPTGNTSTWNSLPFGQTFSTMGKMKKEKENRAKPDIPHAFVARIRNAIDDTQTSARQVALQSDLSAAYFSRLLMGERGLPSDATILKIAEVLNIDPPDLLLLDAGRVPEDMKAELTKPQRTDLLRATGKLTNEDLNEVMKVVHALRSKRSRKGAKR